MFTRHSVYFVVLLAVVAPARGAAQSPSWSIGDVLRMAAENRDEVAAARAAVAAGEERPAIVGALEDPMIAVGLDHIPFMGGGADFTVSIEQRLPLSNIRDDRRAAARADVDRLRAGVSRAVVDVQFEAVNAFVMALERRRTAQLLERQIAIADGLVAAANARYASGTAPQSDVLRGEVELARLRSSARAVHLEAVAAEAMLNASVGRAADTPVPDLTAPAPWAPPAVSTVIAQAVAARPELAAARAAVARGDAEIRVMQDMSRPMATVRTGPAYTMAEGHGWMAMVGVSVPIWRAKQRASIAEARAMRAMSDADLRAMTRMVEGEGAAALGQVRAAVEQLTTLRDDVLPRAQMAVESAMTAYGAGRVPLVSVIEAIQAQWSAAREVVAVEAAEAMTRARLGRAMGSYEGIFQ